MRGLRDEGLRALEEGEHLLRELGDPLDLAKHLTAAALARSNDAAGSDRRPPPQPPPFTAYRPALTRERVYRNAARQVMPDMKAPLRDRTAHGSMPRLGFMQRLAETGASTTRR